MPSTHPYDRIEATEDLLDDHRLLIFEQQGLLSWQDLALARVRARKRKPEDRTPATKLEIALLAYRAYTERLLVTYRHYAESLSLRLEALTPEAS